jgi:hypothetical protein
MERGWKAARCRPGVGFSIQKDNIRIYNAKGDSSARHARLPRITDLGCRMDQYDLPPASRAGAKPGKSAPRGVPGLWPAALVALLAGIAGWAWLDVVAKDPDGAWALGDARALLAQVTEEEREAALGTMAGPETVLAAFRGTESGCPVPLAWVTLAAAPGQPAGALRLRSAGYVSPLYRLSELPVRVAIPYPGPYTAGHGVLTVVPAGQPAVIALQPAWHVAGAAAQTREVRWRPIETCRRPHG